MKKAFTLIELLVVIAIVAILAAILFPVFASVKVAAKGSVAVSNVHQMGLGTLLYQADADDRFPLTAYGSYATGYKLWHDILDPYIKNKDVWHCPGSKVKIVETSGAITSHWGYNFRYLTDFQPDFSNANTATAYSATEADRPSETIVFAAARASVERSWCGDDGKLLLPPSSPSGDCLGRPDPVIQETVPVAWIDGHAKRLALGRFYKGQEPADRYFTLRAP